MNEVRAMIRVEEVSKKFGRIKALDSASMNIEKGSIYGLVGTNGSGKTTMLKHISGVYRADEGEIFIDDEPVFENAAAKQKFCFMADEPYFPARYTLDDMASLFSGLYDNWSQERFDELILKFNLDRKAKVSTFSKGNQKQAAFCLAMASQPEYILMDEPLDGLDPFARRLFWDTVLDDVAEKEMSVIISSHNLRELEDYCDTIGILNKGRIAIEMDIDELKSKLCKVQVAYSERPENPYENLNIVNMESGSNTDLLIVHGNADEVQNSLEQFNPVVLNIFPLTLEEIFIYELGGDNDEYKDIL